MRFNCGMTPEERREIAAKKRLARRHYLSNWHDWFAWYPVRVGHGDCRWLEWVQAKRGDYDRWQHEHDWFYRPIPEERR